MESSQSGENQSKECRLEETKEKSISQINTQSLSCSSYSNDDSKVLDNKVKASSNNVKDSNNQKSIEIDCEITVKSEIKISNENLESEREVSNPEYSVSNNAHKLIDKENTMLDKAFEKVHQNLRSFCEIEDNDYDCKYTFYTIISHNTIKKNLEFCRKGNPLMFNFIFTFDWKLVCEIYLEYFESNFILDVIELLQFSNEIQFIGMMPSNKEIITEICLNLSKLKSKDDLILLNTIKFTSNDNNYFPMSKAYLESIHEIVESFKINSNMIKFVFQNLMFDCVSDLEHLLMVFEENDIEFLKCKIILDSFL